jgi:hypothetical protein
MIACYDLQGTRLEVASATAQLVGELDVTIGHLRLPEAAADRANGLMVALERALHASGPILLHAAPA